jgi:4-hydroxyphenylpyruvate dioxygenase
VVQQGKVRFVLTTSAASDSEIAEHIARHGDGVRSIALWVDDARKAWEETTKRGARSVEEPRVLEMSMARGVASIAAYGDTLHTFIERGDYNGPFLPGYRAVTDDDVARPVGLLHIDTCVGNVGWNCDERVGEVL